MFKKAIDFFKESMAELKKVSWPDKDTAIHSAVIVIIFVVVISLLLFFIDLGVQQFVLWMVS